VTDRNDDDDAYMRDDRGPRSTVDLEALGRLGNVVTAAGTHLPDDLRALAADRASGLAFNDQHRGDQFAVFNASGIHYDPRHDRFRLWNGMAWVEDSSREHVETNARLRFTADLVNELAGPAFAPAETDTKEVAERKKAGRKGLAAWRSQNGRRAALNEAKTITAVPFEKYDVEAEVLNTPTGLVELRTGAVHAHHPGMLVTRVTAAHFDPLARSDAWDKLLTDSMPDEEVRRFVQDAFGATLTGVTAMRALFVLYGPRGTRKSTVTRMFREALGSYAAVLPETAVAASTESRAINEGLATIIGRRGVFCDELTDGFRPNISAIKRLTGSDLVTIEQKFKPALPYRSTAKVWFTTNHPFKIPPGEDAAWERFYVVPFEANPIPESAADKTFADRLAADPKTLSAVLNWGIEGARRVLARNGALVAPSSVIAKRDEVREDSNPLGELIEAGWIVRDPEATAASSDLRRAMEIWAERRGYRPTWAPNHKKLADLLRTLTGVDKSGEVRDRDGNRSAGWRGLRVAWEVIARPGTAGIP
jgi:putative DNA primase/helicase